MTIKHSDPRTPQAPDYEEPDATIILLDCLCGYVGNELELTTTTANYAVVYSGRCGHTECGRTLRVEIGTKKAKPAPEAVHP